MTHRILIGGAAALAAVGGLLTLTDTAEATRPAGPASFALDPVHSAVMFELTHYDVSHAWGRFNTLEGSFTVDTEDLSKSSISLTVDAESVDTNNEKRDQHLRSADFFSTKQFPSITFESTAVRPTGEGTMDVVGDLTFLGQTKEVTAEATLVGMAETSQGTKAGFNATLVIDRTDFGNDTYTSTIGKDVTLHISVEGNGR